MVMAWLLSKRSRGLSFAAKHAMILGCICLSLAFMVLFLKAQCCLQPSNSVIITLIGSTDTPLAVIRQRHPVKGGSAEYQQDKTTFVFAKFIFRPIDYGYFHQIVLVASVVTLVVFLCVIIMSSAKWILWDNPPCP